VLACMRACLLDNSTIILNLLVVKRLKPVFILFSKTVLFFYIRTDLLYWHVCTDHLYQYCFIVLWYLLCLPPDMPLFDTWLLHAITWHLFYITYHLPSDILPLDLWLSYFANPILLSYIIYSDLYFKYLCTPIIFVTPEPVLLVLFP